MSLIIQANLPMMNTQRNYKVNTGNKAKTMERLSSGYKLNVAADDASGLAISEKMRRQIRGLNRGAKNGQDGISWVQIGDGALGEVQAMLHRMKELAIQSLNDTNTETDRAALQAEMDAIQSEIDNVSNNTQFNTQNIFEEHKPTYYQYSGNVQWSQSQIHVIDATANELTVKFKKDAATPAEEITVSVPAGEYTTQELTDELEDALIAAGAKEKGINVEYTDEGRFNVNIEDGEIVESVTGDLAYILYDTYNGGGAGALIGTTVFPNDTRKMNINSNNNELEFDIEYFDGTKDLGVKLTIPTGQYSRPELLDILNAALNSKQVEAVASGSGIKLQSDVAIITGFKGNMFKIDGGLNPDTSIFYDNVKYGNVVTTSGKFVGAAVIPEDARDDEHRKFKIDSTNNKLSILANESDVPVELTIDEDEYTIDEMVSKLNSLFADKNLELEAIVYDGGSFKGIQINSLVKGSVSKVEPDKNSSAYATLFTDRVYNDYVDKAAKYTDDRANDTANFIGGKQFTSNNIPLQIVAGQNDKIQINIGDADHFTITLRANTYATAEDLKNEINEQLNGTNAPALYKNDIVASVDNGKIKLTASVDTIKKYTDGESFSTLNIWASEVAGNNGYDNVFVGKQEQVKPTVSSASGTSTAKPQITLNTGLGATNEITDANKNLTINVNGENKTVTLPTGSNVTRDEIVNAINTQLAEKTVETLITFSDISAKGSTVSHTYSKTGTGSTQVSHKTYSGTGTSSTAEGSIAFATNIPASVKMDVALPDKITIDSNNNTFQVEVNGTTGSFTFNNGTYTRDQIVNTLQNFIDNRFTKEAGKGAVVSLDSANQLVITARIDENTDGKYTSVAYGTSTSSFVKALKTKETAASITTNAIQSSISIDDTCNKFSFDYTEDGVAKTANLTLTNGNYDRTAFVNMLNSVLKANNINVTASNNGTGLKLTTNTVGSDNRISINTNPSNVGNSTEAIFGPKETKYAAVGTANADIKGSITIDGNSDEFNVKVDGTTYNLTLDHNTYDRQGFVNMLNTKLAGTGISATLDGNRIKYTSDEKGAGVKFDITYANGGNSMKAIYGSNIVTKPGVTAEFNQQGQLVLTGTQNGGSLSVSSDSGSVVQKPNVVINDIAPTKDDGYYSKKHSYVDGVSISEPVDINKWNNDFTFNYIDNGSTTNISISLAEKSYTYDELKNALQNEIDRQAGANKLEVTVSDTGVRIEAVNAGSNYSMSGFDGDFYYKVMSGTKEKTDRLGTSYSNGAAPKDLAYTVGRKDVKTEPVEIKNGINDTLSIDFKYGNNETTFTIQLSPGTYMGDTLKEEVQKKLNEAMKAQGFPENMIKVGIGGINTGVVGSNDDKALNFTLASDVRLPADGEYIIDGVSGNAAFSIFYQSLGELIPAYVKGAKDLSEGVTIEAGANELSFEVDNQPYTITLDLGKYTADEIVAAINGKISGAPVVAEIDGGVLKFSYKELGKHTINNFTGSGKQVLFFNEKGEKGEEKDIKIQLSSEQNDYVTIDVPIINTVYLGINSIAITKPKYADKAIERIDEALNMVSAIRSNFGATQNRLEYAIRNVENNSENTQAAESLIRDADMEREMVEYSKQNILAQVGEAVMSHMMTNAEGVLKLLQM